MQLCLVKKMDNFLILAKKLLENKMAKIIMFLNANFLIVNLHMNFYRY